MKAPRFTGRADFWRSVVIAVLALMIVFLYLQNRSLLHTARVEACIADQETNRKLYIAAADLGLSPAIRDRFLPTERCEDLP